MAFKEFDDLPKLPPIDLPIHGKVYSFPGEISARSWWMVQELSARYQKARRAAAAGIELDPDDEVLSDLDEEDLRHELFGGLEAQMIADGLTSSHMKKVFYTLIAYQVSGREVAEAVWNSGETSAPNRKARRTSAK